MGLLPALITKTLRENSINFPLLLRQTRLIGHCKLNEVRKDGWTKLIRCLWLDQLLFYYMKEDHRSYGRNSFTVAKRKPENNCVDLLSYYSSPRSSYIWFSYIPNFIIILLQVYNESIQRSAPSWLVSSTGRALPRYRRGKGFESSTSQENVFSRIVFETSKVASITAIMFFHIIIHPVVLIYDFHIFITSFFPC